MPNNFLMRTPFTVLATAGGTFSSTDVSTVVVFTPRTIGLIAKNI